MDKSYKLCRLWYLTETLDVLKFDHLRYIKKKNTHLTETLDVLKYVRPIRKNAKSQNLTETLDVLK